MNGWWLGAAQSGAIARFLAFTALAMCCGSNAEVVFSGPERPDYEAAVRLSAARSLRCRFTSVAITQWSAGERNVTTKKLKTKSDAMEVLYRDIDARKGTATRDLGNLNATQITVTVDIDGALWLVETSRSGGFSVTTVFPTYAANSRDFIVLESQHAWRLGVESSQHSGSVEGRQYSGTCSVMD